MSGHQRSGDLRSRFPTAADALPPADIQALRRRAYGQGLIVIDVREDAFRKQPWATQALDWYVRCKGVSL